MQVTFFTTLPSPYRLTESECYSSFIPPPSSFLNFLRCRAGEIESDGDFIFHDYFRF
jgi:hypothetical protein